MRLKSFLEIKRARKAIVDRHEWYLELMGKLTVAGKKLSETEALLMSQIRVYSFLNSRYVEDEVKFTPSLVQKLIRVIPAAAFGSLEIQRILGYVERYIKVKGEL